MRVFYVLFFLVFFISCKPKNELHTQQSVPNSCKYATGLAIYHYKNFSLVEVNKPWEGASKTYKYLLKQKNIPALLFLINNKIDTATFIINSNGLNIDSSKIGWKNKENI